MLLKKSSLKLLSGLACSVLAVSLVASAQADAKRVNSKESIKACKAHLLQQNTQGVKVKFKNKSATQVDNNSYKHWLNAVKTNADGRESLKVLCETTRAGKVVTLDVQSGSWKF